MIGPAILAVCIVSVWGAVAVVGWHSPNAGMIMSMMAVLATLILVDS